MKMAPLKDLCLVFGDGDWIESKDQADSGIRLIQTGNVGSGVFKDRIEKARWISDDTFKRLRCTEIGEGDVLISRLPEPVGRACLLPALEHKAITAVDCSIVRFHEKKIEPRYFIYYSQSPAYALAIEPLISGSTRQRISREKLGTIQIPLPPLGRQREIVEKLDGIFAELDLLEDNGFEQREMNGLLLEAKINEEFRLVGFGKSLGTLGEFAEINYGYTAKSSKIANGTKYLRITDIQDKSVNWENVPSCEISIEDKNRFCLKKGDIVFARTGATTGKSYLIDQEVDAVFASYLIRVKPDLSKLNPEFLYFFFQSSYYWDEIERGISGSAQGGFNASKLNAMKVSFPSDMKIQLGVAERIRDFEIELNRRQTQLSNWASKITALRQSLLNSAFIQEEAVA